MPASHPTRTRAATRAGGDARPSAGREGTHGGPHADGPQRLDLDATFVIGLRDLGRRPGNALPVHRHGPLADRLGLEMIAVEKGTDVDADLLLQSASEGVLVTGTVRAAADGECGRCLGPVHETVTADVTELFAYPASLTEQTSDEDEIYRVGVTRDGNDAIDVEPVLRDAIVLALPLTPLCRPDCEGLCVECGEPLADLPADHHHDRLDPRFAGLAALRDTLGSEPPADAAGPAGTAGLPDPSHRTAPNTEE